MIEQQKVVGRRVWPGLPQLLHDPETVRISRHVQVQNSAAVMANDEETIQDPGRRFHGRKTQGQHIRRAARFLPKTVQIMKGRIAAAWAGIAVRLMDYFGLGSKIQLSRNSMISLVAGGGFEPPTFGL